MKGIIIVDPRAAVSGYIIIITLIGLAALGMAWMPSITRLSRVSYAIFYLVLGMLIYLFLGRYLPAPDPIKENVLTTRLTELVVIVSLMGTGLKIDQPFSFHNWAVPFRLISITMVLSIIIVTIAAFLGFGFDLPSALLLGAVLAPTDPVLASDVQVGPPLEETRNKVKFSLTAEAGMNDGSAFPFTWLAILLAAGNSNGEILSSWAVYYFFYKITGGVLIGYVIGRVLSYLLFRVRVENRDVSTKDGFVAIAATLLVYGITELASAYGFIAVFVTAITIRNSELHHKYHRKLHEFTDQVERIFIAVILILFGGSLVHGILNPLTVPMIIFGFVFILLIRPATTLAGMIGNKMHIKERLAISFFGIRGMGSFFYLAFALQYTYFKEKAELWSIVSFVVMLSILVHGITATPVMLGLEKQFGKKNA